MFKQLQCEVAQTAANEDATQVAAQASEAAVAEAAAAETAALQATTSPRGAQAAVEEIPAPFGSMEYMPEAWRNFKIDLEEFLPSSTDAELIKLYCNFIQVYTKDSDRIEISVYDLFKINHCLLMNLEDLMPFYLTPRSCHLLRLRHTRWCRPNFY